MIKKGIVGIIYRRNCLKGGFYMAPTAVAVNRMLENLEEEDFQMAITFIQYLSDTRKKKKAENSKSILAEIQGMFQDDKGWKDEESMIADMAAFRKERMGL